MLIIDGMSLVDWVEIRDTWQAKHPEWRINDRLLLAQIPTITSVSRQALVSGLRPIDFADSMDSTDRESVRWRSFWERQSLPSGAVAYRHISLDQIADLDSGLLHMRMLCLVDTSIDERIHGTTMGAAELRSDRRVWIEGYGLLIESLLERLLQAGFSVWITSDHGHVAARGIGQPNDGVIADVRAKRARIYQTEEHAHDVLSRFARTTLWGDDGLLPRNMWVVNPSDREAFTRFNDLVVTHGGLNIEEMIVPLISIERIQHD
jgi:hypothetical protein